MPTGGRPSRPTRSLLYTDGLVERRGGRHHRRPGPPLRRPRAGTTGSVGDFVDAVLADLVPARLDDDVAVLAVKFRAWRDLAPRASVGCGA